MSSPPRVDHPGQPPNVMWRAFIGEPGDRTVLDVRGVTWERARDALLDFARDELDDGGGDFCPHCRSQAEAAVRELSALPAGVRWSGGVDWDDLILVADETCTDPGEEK